MGHALSFAAVGLGAALGAWLRWGLGLWLAGMHDKVQLGTLVANLSGGYLAGLALAFFAATPAVAAEWRLFAITGLLGGLTTFSTFSGEAMLLLQRGEHGWALAHSALHLAGSIICCIAGYATWRLVSS
ncbi:fluoride efflux transporter CrcB [Massilia sp. PAMC28688]|uniref:fluoride efflux transporter CrcB n=1 Tax=Massilia sp. PAMC28688 TaxID=2861283 RepID=UPI001C63AFA1|nr:fluoride efflux transporter CrcB [Massilia sp. PAMC28688]QYF92546.1 fluoride efflux transporter CrcB [Massilia sp. PAMC28688]